MHTRYCFLSFLHECKLMQDMDHENVVKCLGVVTLERRHFLPVKSSTPAPLLAGGGFGLVQEFCTGGSIADLLLKCETSPLQKLFSPQQALQWCKDVCAALVYIHTRPQPVIHRDLKLDNVLLTEGAAAVAEGTAQAGAARGAKRTAKLADFGLGACITKGVARVATHVRAPTDLDLDVSLTTALEAAHEGSRVGHAPADVSRHLSTVGSAAAAGNALQALAATEAASTPNKPSFESASITPDTSIGTPGFSLASVDSAGAVPEGGADVHGAGADAAASGERGVGSPGGSIGGAATPSLSASATEAARMSTLEPIKEARESNCVSLSGRMAHGAQMESVTSSVAAEDSLPVMLLREEQPPAISLPDPCAPAPAAPAPVPADDAIGDQADQLLSTSYGITDMHTAATANTYTPPYGAALPPTSWPRMSAPQNPDGHSNSGPQSLRGADRPGATSVMTSTSSAYSLQLPVPPGLLGSANEARSRSVSPPSQPGPPGEHMPQSPPRPPAPVVSHVLSPRPLVESPGHDPLPVDVQLYKMFDTNDVIDARLFEGGSPGHGAVAVATGAQPGPIAEGVELDASDDDASSSSWPLRQRAVPPGQPAHDAPCPSGVANRGHTGSLHDSEFITDAAPSSPEFSPAAPRRPRRTFQKLPSGLPPIAPQSMQRGAGEIEGPAMAAHVSIEAAADAIRSAAADVEPRRAQGAAAARLSVPSLRKTSAPPPSATAAAPGAGGDEEPPSVRAVSVGTHRSIVNVYTVTGAPELTHSQSHGEGGPKSDRPHDASEYPAMGAPLSAPTQAPPLRGNEDHNAHLKYKTYAHSSQRVVSVSQVLPSNFLMPSEEAEPPLPSSATPDPAATASSDDPAARGTPSDDTRALYGSARDSADGAGSGAADSSPERVDRTGGARLANEGSGVLRAEHEAAKAQMPQLHQVFGALAQKVARVEVPGAEGPEQPSVRGAHMDGVVAFRSGTDIVPQAWAQRKGHEALPPAALSDRIVLPARNAASSASGSRLSRLVRSASSTRLGIFASRRLLSRGGGSSRTSLGDTPRAPLSPDAPPPDVYGAVRGERWRMTGETGSLIYMAPEVLIGKPYNAKVDIFSLGVIVYQIFGCQNISGRFDSEEQVVRFAREVAEGRRLSMPKRFPPALTALIERLWQQVPAARPTAAEALTLLEDFESSPDFAGMLASKSRGCSCF